MVSTTTTVSTAMDGDAVSRSRHGHDASTTDDDVPSSALHDVFSPSLSTAAAAVAAAAATASSVAATSQTGVHGRG